MLNPTTCMGQAWVPGVARLSVPDHVVMCSCMPDAAIFLLIDELWLMLASPPGMQAA